MVIGSHKPFQNCFHPQNDMVYGAQLVVSSLCQVPSKPSLIDHSSLGNLLIANTWDED